VLEQALTFRQADPQLQKQADAALEALADDGRLATISKKYFDADLTVKEGSKDVKVKGSDSRTRWEVLSDTAPKMLVGLIKGTIPLTIISFLVGLALAVLTALARLSSIRPLDWIARFYITVILGTPLLVQLFLIFFGLPQVGIKPDPYVAAAIAFSLNVGGYAAEIVRASILSVPRGQYEAATVVGMEYWQSMRRIVLPQAARRGPTRTTTEQARGMSDLIEVHGLEKSFGDQRVLEDVDFTAAAGTVTVILGPSRSGKTTVLRSLNVLETPDSGLVRISDASIDFGSPPTDKPAYRRAVRALRARSGMVFQSHNLFPHKTVLGKLVEGPVQAQQCDADEAATAARELLEQVGLAGARGRLPVPALRRPAAADRHRPRAGPQARGAAPRRADIGPRPRACRRGAGRHPRPRSRELDPRHRHP
jgi:His/Glu/Gln/Arg/opine family amino acid ABC transporter permease subunit